MRLKPLLAGLSGAAALAVAWSSAAAENSPAFVPKKGVGIYRPFNWLRPAPVNNSFFLQSWKCFFGATDFARLKKAGFDTVRIGVAVDAFFKGDDAVRKRALADVGSFIRAANGGGLKVAIVLSGDPNSPWSSKQVTAAAPDSPVFRQYTDIAASMARYLSRFDPGQVAFEPFNEPPAPCRWTNRPDWPAFLEVLYRKVRKAAPRTTLILTGACAASAESFQFLPVDAGYVKDPNTIFTLHYYDPYDFTLQSQGRFKYIAGMPYPADPARRAAAETAIQARLASAPDLDAASRPAAAALAAQIVGDYFTRGFDAAYIDRKFDLVEAWRVRARIPAARVMLGEFGAVRAFGANGTPAAADEDRVRWYGLVRRAAEERGHGWLAWSYFADMSIFDDDPPRWQSAPRHLNPKLLDALGLSRAANSITGTSAIGANNPAVCK